MTARGRRAAILLLLDERHRQDPSLTVDDTDIAGALGIPLDEVRRQLDVLEDQELIRSANTFPSGHSAYISPKGMAAADELREVAQEDPKEEIGFQD